jgi:hypothetical protein
MMLLTPCAISLIATKQAAAQEAAALDEIANC